jgi:hypothetical protein
MQSVPSGCIALPRWLRKSLFLSDDLLGHRLTLNFVQVHQLPVAKSITLRCIARDPTTLPHFSGSSSSSVSLSLSLSNPIVILQEYMQSRNFKSLTVGLRFSLFHCRKNDGGCWDLEVCSIKARRNKCGCLPIDEESCLPAGSSCCVFSNCENTAVHVADYELLPDASVSNVPVSPQFPCDDLKPGDSLDFQRLLPPLVFSAIQAGVSPLS